MIRTTGFLVALLAWGGCQPPAVTVPDTPPVPFAEPAVADVGDEAAQPQIEPARPQIEPADAEAARSAAIQAGQWSQVDEAVEVDDEIEAIIKPYREKLQVAMQEEIGVAEASVERGRPESPLGCLVADAILHHARTEIDPGADFALMNRGGIRLPEIPAGPITVADIYQLVPFDNYVVVLTLTGAEVETLIQTLAVKQGELYAGVVYQLVNSADGDESWSARDIQVAGAPLARERTYKLATLDYLAGIGGELAVLQEASQRQDGQLYLRDVVIEDIRRRETIAPAIDGRVSVANETGE